MPAVREHLTPKNSVDQTVSYWLDEISMLGLDSNEKVKLDKQDSIIINSSLTTPKTRIELPTKSNVDSLQERSRNRRDLSSVFNDQDNENDNNKLTNLGSVSVKRDPCSDNELANMIYIDNELDKNTVLRFNQTLENYLKVSV